MKGLVSSRRPNQTDWNGNSRDFGIEIVGIYHRAGRHADVLALLETLPMWDASDLAEIYSDKDDRGTPLGHMAAAALADAKKDEQALKIVNAVLDSNGGYDPADHLLLKLEGPRAMLRFDELFARDQFEERPLIWKASQLIGPRVDEAEKVARQAISIDPSDGEQGKGTRMRVYSVLADILEKKGDAEQAKVYRGAVQAIRIAEDADDWWEAGLLSRAIKQYEDALTHFQDAYCIQSRLALRMAELGLTEKAEAHYRKAYELMPDSFGRMVSHCFGCEGAFNGSSARKIAEQVFTRLLQKQPDKPQLHYLLGYLREQEWRFGDALSNMQQAVKLDPDYLNAWKHIRDLSQRIYLAPDVRDAAALNLMRLDPLGRHVSDDVGAVRDLKGLWAVAAKAVSMRTPPPKSLMPLPASAAEMRKNGALQVERPADDTPQTPGAVLAGTRALSAVGEILDAH
jgi:tetratricopeptide (TPR) repeat protein